MVTEQRGLSQPCAVEMEKSVVCSFHLKGNALLDGVGCNSIRKLNARKKATNARLTTSKLNLKLTNKP